ncbi:adenosine receptor A3-like [Oculina patagonica]
MENTSMEALQISTCAMTTEVLRDFLPIWITYVVISINVTLCITAALGNILILIALQEDCSLRSPSKLLFRSLASTDLCVGLISQPCFVTHLVLIAKGRLSVNICHITEGIVGISSAILCGISIFTVTAISVDRLLALLLALRYRQVVTLARVRGVTITSWLVFPLLSMLYFWNVDIFMVTLCVNVMLCLAASTFCFMKIYFTLRYRQTRVSQQSGPEQNNIATRVHVLRYKKTVSSSLWVYFTLIASYLPFAVVQVARAVHGESPSIVLAEGSTTSLVYLNSSINPIIYCWRIREVRQAVKATIRRFSSLCF